MVTPPPKIDYLLKSSGLRIRLFIFNLRGPRAKRDEIGKFFTNTSNISLDVDFFNESPQDIIDQLKHSKFIAYSSIIIIVNRLAILCHHGIDELLQAMASNVTLRLKSKILLIPYGIDGPDNSWDVVFNDYADFLGDENLMSNIIYPKNFKHRKGKLNNKNINRFHASRDYNDYHSLQLPNIVMMQLFVPNEKISVPSTLDCILFGIHDVPTTSVQDLLVVGRGIPGSYKVDLSRRLVISSTNAGLYFYAINPALAIIFNNYFFTSPDHEIRRGSDRDVAHLLRVLKLTGIPHVLVEDCNQAQMLQVLDYVKEKDFTPLKSLILVLMSHGKEGNMFETRDGQVNIHNDVLSHLQANPSLKGVETLVLANFCRGVIDLDYEDYDAKAQLHTRFANGRNLSPNISILYSIPDGIKSPRSPLWGSPFVQSFCRHLANMDPTENIVTLDKEINKDLKKDYYYDDLERCSDIEVGDPCHLFSIAHLPIQALQMLQLMQSIAIEFPVREPITNDMLSRFLYVCGALNKEQSQHREFLWKYFGPDLEYETCELENVEIPFPNTQ